jgi:acetylornithine deacetylase/succinyl-diaminopimelate desuccinylase-like protein
MTAMLRPLSILLAAGIFLFAENMPSANQQRLAHEIYKELVETNTSFTTGQTTPAAEAVARRLRAAGFPAAGIQVLGASPKKMNVVVRYRGTGAKKPLLLLAHLDVVEALRADWSIDPFVLTEKDGYFYGRGTSDDKAQAAIWVANLIQYKLEGFQPNRDLIVALTADEEGGGPFNGVQYLLKNRRDLIDAEFCLNEGGGGEMRGGRKILNAIQVSEKTGQSFRFEVKNPGGHSSMPVAENAIYRLAASLDKLSKYKFPITLNDTTRAYFVKLGDIEKGPAAADLQATGRGDLAAAERIAAQSAPWNATLRTTCVATMLDGGHAQNALPQTAGALVNCRILPGQTPEEVQRKLKQVIADAQVTISTMSSFGGGPPSPMRDDVLKTTARITESMWPGVPAVPIMVMGGTDGSHLRKAGIPTYGVTGLFTDTDDIRIHGRDERIGVKEFYEAQTFLYRLVKDLSQ